MLSFSKKTTAKIIDYLKSIDNIVRKADKIKLMSQYLLEGVVNKKILCECMGKWCDKRVKNFITKCFTNAICY